MTLATATNSNSKKGLDEPVTDPTNDLLDVDQHARALANYIREKENELPLTVGIFGEWGEGKTTMVRFLEHHLRELRRRQSGKEIKFVTFSAWPFTTSEKLWRALILKIAEVLFDHDPRAAEEKQKTRTGRQKVDSNSRWDWVSTFLSNDFFPRKDPPAPLTEYEQFVKELEETDFGRISKRTPAKQVSQEAIMSAVVNGALTVLGTMSPLVSGLRGLFGAKIDVEQLTQSQKDESSTQAVEALPSFRNVFGNMLNAKTDEGEAVYVFIDDLDRAQPDVALDIMESIRIALNEVSCVFIIAVDETLISQGLRLRYRELFAEANKTGEVEALANKGQEYLEKIIQFRTRVPPRTSEQMKRLIAAEFPYWTPAGDIIQTIANNNPRRIKQYCQRLSFQNDVGSTFILGSASEETEPSATDFDAMGITGGEVVIGQNNLVILPGSKPARVNPDVQSPDEP
ncbi:MAG TPA: P-loop NTPase fold protein [Pyrinomonadaceae bacterium]|nr:P-loop NTPase fold protein [Pyrinomonadaceae bacterium]